MSPLETLKNKAFRDLWLGQAISQFGDALYYVVFAYMVLKITGSNAAVGYIGAIETLPYLLLTPYAGPMADRIDRRKIMLYGDILCALVLGGFCVYLAFDPKPPFAVMAMVAGALSSIRVFFWPAKNASIPRLVPDDQLLAANSLSQLTQSIAPMMGLALTGGLIAYLFDASPGTFFLMVSALNGASFLFSAYYIFKLPSIVPERSDEPQKPLEDARDGFTYLMGRSDLKALLLLQTIFHLAIAPFYPIYMATNKEWFGDKPQGVVWIEFTFFLGMVVGGLTVSKLKIRAAGKSIMLGALAVGLTVLLMAWSQSFWLYNALNFAAGVAVPFVSIIGTTYIQATTEDAFRGRVNSAMNMVTVGVQPLGLSMAGIIIDKVGLVRSYIGMGIGMIVSPMLTSLSKPFRNAEIPQEPKVQTEPKTQPEKVQSA